MTSIVDDVAAVKARLDEIEREKAEHLAKRDRAADATFEESPWSIPVVSDIYMYSGVQDA